MKKTIMVLAVASIVAACAGSSNTESNDSTAVTVESVAVDTAAVAPVDSVK